MKASDLFGKVRDLDPDKEIDFFEFLRLWPGFIEHDLEDIIEDELGYKVWVESKDEDDE